MCLWGPEPQRKLLIGDLSWSPANENAMGFCVELTLSSFCSNQRQFCKCRSIIRRLRGRPTSGKRGIVGLRVCHPHAGTQV